MDRYQQLPYCLQISLLSKECIYHIYACNNFSDAIFPLVIIGAVMKDLISSGVYLLSLWAPLSDTISQLSNQKMNLVISRTVTRVVVWMKKLTRLFTWKMNPQGSFLDKQKIKQCTIFLLVYQKFNNAKIMCDSR